MVRFGRRDSGEWRCTVKVLLPRELPVDKYCALVFCPGFAILLQVEERGDGDQEHRKGGANRCRPAQHGPF
jgi:hypothetical protein